MIPKNVIERLRSANEPVPTPARLPTPAEVAAAERELNISFHPDLRRFLLEVSDVVFGTLEPVTATDPADHTDIRSVCRSAWDHYGVPASLTPICENNADFYCINGAG